MPAIGLSLILIAIGAILAFAVTATVQGVAIATVGAILMAVGGLGLVIALLFLLSFSPVVHDEVDQHHHHDHI